MSRVSDGSDGEAVVLGRLTKVHGLRGEIRLQLFNPESNSLRAGSEVLLQRDGITTTATIESMRGHAERLLVKLRDHDGREAAEALRGAEVAVPRAALPDLASDEYYLVDLIGLRAVNESGQPIGIIREVMEYPSVACLEIEDDTQAWEVPVLERYVVDVVLDADGASDDVSDGAGGRVVIANLDEVPSRRHRKRP